MVKRAIDSVLNQTIKPFEIIVIDDGSTDGTSTLFPIQGVSYLKVEHSGFPGKARNIGVEHSAGDYIAFLDSDDIWHPEKLEMQSAYIKGHPSCRILHTKEEWIMNGKVISQKKRRHKRAGDIFIDSLQGCIIGPSTALLTRALYLEYKGFKEDIEVGEDYDLWLRVTDREDVHYIDRALITKYAGHGDQLSFKYGFIEPFKITVLEDLILNHALKAVNSKEAITSLIKKYDIVINGCLKRDNSLEALEYSTRKEHFLEQIGEEHYHE